MTDQAESSVGKMELPIEETLYQAVLVQDQYTVSQVLSKGANPNRTISQGRTCLGEAAIIGNIDILKLLISGSKKSTVQQKISSRYIPPRRRKHRTHKRKFEEEEQCDDSSTKCIHLDDIPRRLRLNNLPITERNQGYFVVVHNESPSSEESKMGSLKSPLSSSSQTCSPQADLEWDEEIGNTAPATAEDEKCSSIYKWYARILESTGAALASASVFIPGINQQDVSLKTALHYAAEENHAAAVTLLIEAGCCLDIPAEEGYTPLHLAVLKNNFNIVKILLKAGSQVNYPTREDMTALHLAATEGFVDLVDLLLNNGAHLEAKDMDERTAFFYAVRRGNVDVVRYLIAAGANMNGEEVNGFTPLCEAVWQSHPVVLEMLLQAGVRVCHTHKLLHKAIGQREEDLIQLLAHYGGGLNVRNEYGDSPLMLSGKLIRPSIARILLRYGAKPNLGNTITGENALHFAVQRSTHYVHFEEFLKLLIEHKADINATALTGDTPLNRALLLQRDHAAMFLIRHGADVNKCDLLSVGLDNLSLACKRDTINMASLVLKAGHYFPTPDPSALEPMPGTTDYWLYWTCRQPLTLTDLCRIKIRNIGKDTVLHLFISSLPLPKPLKGYLMMEDEGIKVRK